MASHHFWSTRLSFLGDGDFGKRSSSALTLFSYPCFIAQQQTHGPDARPIMTLNAYTELRDSKGVVLMRGEVDTKRLVSIMLLRRMNIFEAQEYLCGLFIS